jgi:transcriptional regulator with GAF, ATPase, and Fis domain
MKDAATVAAPAASRDAIGRKIARGTMNLRDEVSALERMAIEEALARTGGNAAEAARLKQITLLEPSD